MEKSKKHKKEQKIPEAKKQAAFHYIIYAGLLILLFYPPYFRGLFFDRELLPTHIYSGILFLAWMIYRTAVLKETGFFRSPADYAALAVVGAYFLSIFAAVNLRYAVGELLKYINYFIVYYLVSDIARNERDKRIILWTLVLSAAGVALAGIGAAAGTVKYPGAFVGSRINSTLQYPNTLAAYLTAALMLGLGLQAVCERRWQRAVLSAINYTLFLAFLFTLSRAAWLMFPVFYLILIISIPGAYRMKVLGYSLQVFFAGIIVSPGFGSGISGGEGAKVWLWYLVGLILAPAVFYIFDKLSERFAVRIKPATLLSVFVILTLIAGTGAYIALTTEKPLTLSHSPDEPESWKTSWYTVDNVKPDTDYVLKVMVTATPGQEEGKWGGAVQIMSIDKNNKATVIKSEYFNEALEQQLIEVPFKTRTDTTKLQIGFSNRFPGTSAVYSDAKIFQAAARATSQKIILAYKYIPEAIAQRLSSISFGEHSFQGRLSFYRDALKIIKEHPVIGIGGGGWKSAYFAYQSYRYFTTEVHSFFLQLMVETGITGLLAFLAVPVLIIRNVIVNKADDQGLGALNYAALSSAAAILGHSAVDFNLSLAAVAIYLWALFGLAAADGMAAVPVVKRRQLASGSYAVWAAGGLTLLFILGSATLFAGYSYGQKAVRALQSGDLAGAKEAFERASEYDPLTVSFKADLSQIYDIIGEQGKNKEFKEKAIKLREEAAAMEPYNAKMKGLLAATYLREGRLEEGLSLLEEAARLNPYNITVWEALVEGYEKVAEFHIAKNEVSRAKELLGKSLAIPERIIDFNRKSPQNDPGVVKLQATKDLMLYLTKAEKLLESPNLEIVGKLKDLVFAANFGIDLDEDGQPDLWRVYGEGEVKVNPGRYSRMKLAGESTVTLNLIEGIYLEPDEFYKIELEADILKGGYRVDIIADNKVIFNSGSELSEFIAPGEIEGKDIRIRVIILPKSDIMFGRILLYKNSDPDTFNISPERNREKR
ncbi:O-antigen ligase family protein [Thermosediminibacter litoriperuensis]|uniref:O-antigen ligase-like membrane protein n=1 Tax=Thermosediminibacter litoriperuensis TaxID=291989 RepID=A0A5S5ALW7_9FIRM|nr:O-antigen ligase family protein [Thermosediminibacter litoriperuensis]TYP52417.1 O-antigen ligase-like membrane protein [Thermosediminibacter litoriperuensis]